MSRAKREQLRQEVRRQRRSLAPEVAERYSLSIAALLQEQKPLYRARVIMGYLAIENEVNVWPYLAACLRQGKTILLPRVEKDGMVAVPFVGMDLMRTGSFSIREPLGPGFPPENIEAVIVPGLVFDERGYRLGYGKGYYDRFLPLLQPSAFICGVAYSFQVVDDVMPHARDFRVPYLFTEKGQQGK